MTHAVPEKPALDAVRLDVWLWAARFFKTRTLAKHAIDGGKIDVNAQPCKPGKAVRVGDVLHISRGEERFEVAVLGLAELRGPAPVAQALYRESDASRQARAQAAEQRRLEATGYARPPTKPDKRARRLIKALGDIDSL
ncbi:RNA-binding S4 domain-containing protein [Tahibacter soli]|jgi:ribosome-associated heat shock protein Hsp15|uniref:Heat shock protein 15 n=1 Tax=Tahibacter soli TaxID=2983605 RepID=A0A9X4BIL8_9GAMM|nr:S4 domain-containing protein [Tahibacter soli]MDC8015405.1 S4 domain-containing protein [Tahibacter soli]